MKIRILSRYIGRAFLGNVLSGLVLFTFVLLLDRMFELVDLLLNKGVSLYLTLKLVALLMPSTLSLTLPMACLLAALLTYGRFSETSEIIAMQASGLSPWSYMKVPIFLGFLASLFLLPFNTTWAPRSHAAFRAIYVEVLGMNPLLRIEEKTFVEIGSYNFYVRKKSRKNKRLRGVSIYKVSGGGPPLRIYAQDGEARVDPKRGVIFTLHKGHLAKIDPLKPTEWLHTAFETYVLQIPLESKTQTSERVLEEMDSRELSKRIRELKSKGQPNPILACQYHLRNALAMTPFLFVILGIPLAIRVHRGARSIGFALSLGIIVVYYVLIMGGSGLGQRGILPPFLAVWAANGILAGTAFYFIKKFRRK